LRSGLLFFLAAVVSTGADAQHSSPTEPALPADVNQFVREMVQHELDAGNNDHTLWRYRLHKEDEAAAQDRDVIETKEGSLARTLLINGKPLTPEQRSKDEERMKTLVDDPNERPRRDRRARQDEKKPKDLPPSIPDAFILKYDGMEAPLPRLAFSPNPHYSPPTRELMVYHAMTGKLWVDRAASRLAMIEGR